MSARTSRATGQRASSSSAAAPVRFSFEHASKTYTFPVPLFEAITVGFVRRNRRLSATDFSFTALEALAGDSVEGQAVLDVLDGLPRSEFQAVARQLDDQLGTEQLKEEQS